VLRDPPPVPTSARAVRRLRLARRGGRSGVAVLLDQLAGIAGPVGNVVRGAGDALALRSGSPRRFDRAALHAWATNPAGALTLALPSIVSTGLTTLAPLVDAFAPASVNVTANANTLSVTAFSVSLGWTPSSGVVSVGAVNLAVPGVNRLGFTVAISAAGLNELTVMAGPAQIDAGGVTVRPFVAVSAGLAPAGGRRVAVGLAVDDSHRSARAGRSTGSLRALMAATARSPPRWRLDPLQVALRAVEVVADLVGRGAGAGAGAGAARQPDRRAAGGTCERCCAAWCSPTRRTRPR
jgi:hypothetical protein